MADIKQAARWLNEGKQVCSFQCGMYDGDTAYKRDGCGEIMYRIPRRKTDVEMIFTPTILLADDWAIAEYRR
jgi:predicted nucleic acid-binding Zn ribbon protein